MISPRASRRSIDGAIRLQGESVMNVECIACLILTVVALLMCIMVLLPTSAAQRKKRVE